MLIMDLANKISKIEALIASATNDGERQAAEFAKQRLQDKIAAQPIEYNVRTDTPWKKKLFVAICHKHGVYTYRYARQKHTTTMVRVSKPFMKTILWPEFDKYALLLDKLSDEILTDLISKIHRVADEDEVVIAGELPPMQESATQ
jgi:hypothetical protein